MDSTLQKLQELFGENRIKINEPMSMHTTFKIGGPAKYYIEVSDLNDLISVIQFAQKQRIHYFVLGGGSNLIVSDKGINGLVIKNNCRKFEIIGMKGRITKQNLGYDKAFLYAESGVIMNQLVRFAVDSGFAGVEYQLGLPGTVGGGVYMNSNYPKENVRVGEAVYSAKILTKDGQIEEVDSSYFKFSSNKTSIQESKDVILSVVFQLTSENKTTLWERATEALEYRTSTQPKGATAGLTFRNISIVDAMRIPTPNHTTSAQDLLEQAKLKGKRVGNAIVSDVNPNYILNTGDATSQDVHGLIAAINDEMYKKYNTKLELEMEPVGV